MALNTRFASRNRRPATPLEGCMAAHIRLNTEAFENWCGIRGHRSVAAKARFIGVDDSYLGRVIKGERSIGADLVAAICKAFEPWRPHEKTFAALFTIEVDETCKDQAGENAA